MIAICRTHDPDTKIDLNIEDDGSGVIAGDKFNKSLEPALKAYIDELNDWDGNGILTRDEPYTDPRSLNYTITTSDGITFSKEQMKNFFDSKSNLSVTPGGYLRLELQIIKP